jgi:pyridoxal phosphate enzyme (YggS family)
MEVAAARSGRGAKDIRLMGVSKFHPLEMMAEASQFVDLLGENRVQEAEGKRVGWPAGNKTPWHLIGHLQRNKARKALSVFSAIESVDSFDLARALDRILAETKADPYVIYLEVNMSGEASKDGMQPGDAEQILDQIRQSCPRLLVDGLMTIGPNVDDPAAIRKSFANLRELREKLRSSSGLALPELSMGMSGDFETAIEEGSTIVRVGTAIFGPRVYN